MRLVLASAAAVWLAAAPLAAVPLRYHQSQTAEPLTGVVGSDIGDIVWSGHYLWVATDSGVARLDPSTTTGGGLLESDWVTFTQAHGLGRGAVSALAARGDTVWAATLYDTLVPGDERPHQVGSGLAYSVDAGATWNLITNGQIFDPSVPGFERGPTTAIDNACYSVAIDGNTVWAAFFAGSTVRSRDAGRTWKRVLPDGASQIVYFEGENAADSLQAVADSLTRVGGDPAWAAQLQAAADSLRNQHLLHRTFDVLAYHDTVWVGTASGVTRSLDGGQTWRTFRAGLGAGGQLVPGQLAGNWVVAIDRQIRADGSAVIWTGSYAVDVGEANSMAWSTDNGATWTTSQRAAAWGFAFTPGRVWAGTDGGLLVSQDNGQTWSEVTVRDEVIGEELRGAFVGAATMGAVLWVGAENGLGWTADAGAEWRVVKSPVKPLSLDAGEVIGEAVQVDSVRTFAAPNPFSPRDGERARIHFSLSRDARVTIRIYDFASRLVRTLVDGELRAGQRNHGVNWDGLDDAREPVANGVYFYRIELDSGRKAFGKVVVLD